MINAVMTADSSVALSEQIRAGLAARDQKELPCAYLYDEVGSALFEAICVLPEYGLTRAAERLLRNCSDELVRRLHPPVMVAELGSGSGKRTRWILRALSRYQEKTKYCPVEISAAALAECRRELASVDGVSVQGFEKEFLDGLSAAACLRTPGVQILVLFLGSTIGNFHRDKGLVFLQEVRRLLLPGDALLLATDLIKPVRQLLLAYDDPAGVTAAFNLNLLARLNREMAANFVINRFRHQARWNGGERRIEMHILSLMDQIVDIPTLGMELALRKGETIWTESSHKYTLDEAAWMADESGFRCTAQWVDREWPFAQNLFEAV